MLKFWKELSDEEKNKRIALGTAIAAVAMALYGAGCMRGRANTMAVLKEAAFDTYVKANREG